MKFIPLNFLTACFYWKFRKTWCLFKKCIAMNPKNHWVNNVCFNFCLLFLLYLKLRSWNLHFLVCFCYWPNSFMKGDKRGIFSKAPDWKTLFLIKIKIKQNPGCANKNKNVVFKHFRQNIGPIWTNDWFVNTDDK